MGHVAVDTKTRVFLCYRREDTRHLAGRLGDRLTQHFGKVFMDIDNIEPGADFTAAIRDAVGECDVLLALIGPNWLDARDKKGRRRLDDPDDWIVGEIQVALARNIRVIPILVDSAVMPDRDDLPPPLVPLANRQAVTLRHETFPADVTSLVSVINQVGDATEVSSSGFETTTRDFSLGQLHPIRPVAVTVAYWLWIASIVAFGLALLLSLINWKLDQGGDGVAADKLWITAKVVIGMAWGGGYLLLAVKQYGGRNWARVVLTALGLVNILVAFQSSGGTQASSVWLPVLLAVMALVSIVFMFSGRSNKYFKESKAHRQLRR